MERYGAGSSRFHLILLRAMLGIALAMRVAGGRRILARLHDAARKTSSVNKHQCNSEQDQNFAGISHLFLSA